MKNADELLAELDDLFRVYQQNSIMLSVVERSQALGNIIDGYVIMAQMGVGEPEPDLPQEKPIWTIVDEIYDWSQGQAHFKRHDVIEGEDERPPSP